MTGHLSACTIAFFRRSVSQIRIIKKSFLSPRFFFYFFRALFSTLRPDLTNWKSPSSLSITAEVGATSFPGSFPWLGAPAWGAPVPKPGKRPMARLEAGAGTPLASSTQHMWELVAENRRAVPSCVRYWPDRGLVFECVTCFYCFFLSFFYPLLCSWYGL